MSTKTHRRLHEIADEIKADWTKPYFGAVPYLDAMGDLIDTEDHYGYESGDMIVRYFLANASSWKGETARRIKKELRAMIK